MSIATNLNCELIRDDAGSGVRLGDWDMGLGDVRVHFRNLKDKLIANIREADYVFGCVAWLTDFDILDALSEKRGVSLVVQKEDFLRPDMDGGPRWKGKLRAAYDRIPGVDRHHFSRGVAHLLSTNGDTNMEAVRCMGIAKRSPFGPRMHHKFAVFAKSYDNDGLAWQFPYRAWTGSFNWTKTAGQSLENAIVFEELKAVKAYYLEFQQVLALSEALDWTSEWVAPEWRIGT